MHSGEISPQHFYDQKNRLRAFARYIDPTRRASEIVALDIQNYRTKRINEGLRTYIQDTAEQAGKAVTHVNGWFNEQCTSQGDS